MVFAVIALAALATAAYFAAELRAARQERPGLQAAAPAVTAAPLSAAAASTGTPKNRSDPSPAAQSPASAPDLKTLARAWDVKQIPEWRSLLEDPAKREALVREYREGYRKGNLKMARELGLSGDEFTRLASLRADQNLRMIQARYECAIKPDCDALTVQQILEPQEQRELVELLGPEKKQRVDDYQDNQQERYAVTYLRGQMPDGQQLTEAQAARLVEALGEERRRMIREFAQRGTTYSAAYNSLGTMLIADTSLSVEQKSSDAAEFQRRQRERASGVLNAQQLAVFVQTQDQLLEGARQGWENPASGWRP